MHNRPRVRAADETATTEAPARCRRDAAVIEVRATVAGGYSYTVHLLPGAAAAAAVAPTPRVLALGRATAGRSASRSAVKESR